MSIVFLDTDGMYLAILDLLSEDKRALLGRTQSGPIAIPPLEAMAERLAIVTRKGKPYADELAAADRLHDIGAMVLDLICQIHELLGALAEHADAAELAAKVRATLSLERAIIRASYGQTAANAHRNRRKLAALVDTLRRMPAIEGLTAHDVAEMYIGGGEQVGRYLNLRADALAEAETARAEAAGPSLLNEARDLVQRTRAMVTHEVSLRPDLSADLPRRIFATLDERIAVAAAAIAQRNRADASTAAAADAADAEPLDGEGADRSQPPRDDIDDGASEAAESPAPPPSGSSSTND